MDTKICSMCNIGKKLKKNYKRYSECRDCNCARRLKRYYENKEKISNQKKFHKKIEKR